MKHTDSIRITYHPDSLCEFYNFQNYNSKIFYYYYENKNCKSDKNTQINQIFSWHFLSPLLLISSLLFLIYIFISLHATIIPFSHRPYTLSAYYKDVFPLSIKFLFFFFPLTLFTETQRDKLEKILGKRLWLKSKVRLNDCSLFYNYLKWKQCWSHSLKSELVI